MTAAGFTGFIDIVDHGLLLVQGPDAKTFLQGQVTCDIDKLAYSEKSLSILGAHCTPKGRMLFSFRAFALAEDIIALSIPKSLISDAQKALQKYSVFSKVDIIDASEDYRIIGFRDSHNDTQSGIATLPSSANHTITDTQGTIIAIDQNHYEYYLDKTTAEQLILSYPSKLDTAAWDHMKILAGIGEVQAQTADLLLPQMLNYQAIGNGVSFSKGCYTGQEVVARMQYLGKLKRRLFRFSTLSRLPIMPGMPLFTEGSTQSIGNIVLSSDYKDPGDKTTQLLAVATEEACERDSVYLDANYQEKLLQQALPYAIPKE